MKRYPSYKSTDVKWIGEIPSDWEIKRISHVADLLTGFAFKSELFSFSNGTKVVRGDNVTEGEVRWGDKTRFWQNPSVELERFYLNEDDIVIGMDGSKVGKNYAKIDGSELPLLLVQRVARIRSNSKELQNWIYSWIGSQLFRNHVDYVRTDPAIPHITLKDIGDFKITIPPMRDLKRIVTYINEKTSLIDQTIRKKQQLIELLQEERTALINHAVTRGLNPGAKLKPSGVEWLGDVPEHWIVRKLSRSYERISSGTTPLAGSEVYYSGGTVNWINTGDLNDGLLTSCAKKVTEKALQDHTSLKMYPQGSLVIAMYGATIGKLSLLGLEGTTNQACCVLTTSDYFNNKFLFYWLLAFRPHIISLAYGGGQPNISQELIRSLKVPCPNKKEQEKIVSYLDNVSNNVLLTLMKTEQEISLLQEYRTALINEVVTGKRCVVQVDEEVLV